MAASTEKAKLPFLAEILILAAVYFGCGWFGLSLAFVNKSASAVWPPTGLSVAILLLRGRGLWPGVFLGAFLVNILTLPVQTPEAIATSFGIAAGNTLEAVVGCWLAERFANGGRALEQTRTIFAFVLVAGMASTILSATVGLISGCLGGFASWPRFWPIWLTWWLGDLVS